MIAECIVCGGRGIISGGIFDPAGKPCPACNGAGKLDVQIPIERLTPCRICEGRGVMAAEFPFDFGGARVCMTCKGLGKLEIPRIFSSQSEDSNESPAPTLARPGRTDYDIAISFAGEDRCVVEPYASELVNRGLKVFYADFEKAELWGADLYETLDAIYRLRARYCVLFISQNYATKVWTNHERRAAQARALSENREYLLPVRLDETSVPGIAPTIGYIDYREVGLAGLVHATVEKLRPGGLQGD